MPNINKKNDTYIFMQDGVLHTNMFNAVGDKSEKMYNTGTTLYAIGEQILKIAKTTGKTADEKNVAISKLLMTAGVDNDDIQNRIYDTRCTEVDPVTGEVKQVLNKVKATAALNRLLKFFSEWKVDVSLRYVNCLVLCADPVAYTKNYFYVMDHPDALAIAEKIKSPEFAKIVAELKTSGPKPKPINTRLVIFFGAPGAGKTYDATELTTMQIPCASDMLPSDIIQRLGFTDGKPNFDPSDICNAMENGEKILLDEINLLPYPTLRFLQTITDNKDSINFQCRVVKIHPDFKSYGTMNLNVDGHAQPIPQPLADRAEEIKEYVLTAEDLLRALE